MPAPEIPFSSRFPVDLHERMTEAAQKADIAKNTWIMQAVEEKLKREAKK